MNTYDFVHLSLHALGGKIHGKTLLQKTIYFLGVLTGRTEDLGYRAHFYGPYSSDVAEAIDRLNAMRFLEKTTTNWGTVDARGFELTRTDYSLTEDGERIAEKKKRQNPELSDEIERALARFKEAGSPNYVKLSLAAKTYFVLRTTEGVSSKAELTDVAKQFGWNVSEDQIEDAAKFLQKLDLIKIRN